MGFARRELLAVFLSSQSLPISSTPGFRESHRASISALQSACFPPPPPCFSCRRSLRLRQELVLVARNHFPGTRVPVPRASNHASTQGLSAAGRPVLRSVCRGADW